MPCCRPTRCGVMLGRPAFGWGVRTLMLLATVAGHSEVAFDQHFSMEYHVDAAAQTVHMEAVFQGEAW